MCLHVWVCVCGCTCARVHVEAMGVIFRNAVHPFETGALVLELTLRLSWLARKHREPTWACLPRIRMTSTWHQARRVTWTPGLTLRASCLPSKLFMDGDISPGPRGELQSGQTWPREVTVEDKLRMSHNRVQTVGPETTRHLSLSAARKGRGGLP